jgi:hypothetical protein
LKYKGVSDHQEKHGGNGQGKIIGFVGIFYHFTILYVRFGPVKSYGWSSGHSLLSGGLKVLPDGNIGLDGYDAMRYTISQADNLSIGIFRLPGGLNGKRGAS